jgi:hypothetical protein
MGMDKKCKWCYCPIQMRAKFSQPFAPAALDFACVRIDLKRIANRQHRFRMAEWTRSYDSFIYADLES